MKLTLYIFKFFILFLLFSSCDSQPEPINYGADQCHYCRMNIVDQQHAAQYVTKKGKQFKFDAIECMINQLVDLKESEMAVLLVSSYGNPGEMTDAITATYLISPKLKSPMGAFLTAFNNREKAVLAQKDLSGQLYDWKSIKIKIGEK